MLMSFPMARQANIPAAARSEQLNLPKPKCGVPDESDGPASHHQYERVGIGHRNSREIESLETNLPACWSISISKQGSLALHK